MKKQLGAEVRLLGQMMGAVPFGVTAPPTYRLASFPPLACARSICLNQSNQKLGASLLGPNHTTFLCAAPAVQDFQPFLYGPSNMSGRAHCLSHLM